MPRGPKPGYKQTPEHIAARIKSGEEHPNWMGDAITRKSGRSRALRMFPEIGPCVVCGSPRSERHHDDENTLNNSPQNIIPLCRKCHMKRHGRTIEELRRCQAIAAKAAAAAKNAQACCKRGHLLSGDNLFRTSEGKRGCKECRKIHKATYLKKQKETNGNR